MALIHMVRAGLMVAVGLSAVACGGGGGTTGGGGSTSSSSSSSGGSSTSSGGGTGATNVATVTVDGGPSNNSVNTLFTSVTVCVPGSSTNCQTVDHIQVDTGSYGLRVLASALTPVLPVETLSSGGSLAECVQFLDGFSWGPVVLADIQIGGETASSVPVQVIGDSRFANIPADCSGSGLTEEDTVAEFGANGILGVGPFALDCGDCDINTHKLYFACPSSTTPCTDTTVPSSQQVPNPVTRFAVDKNGVIIDLPAVPVTGELTLTGSLIFGIDTQSNNQSGTGTVLTVNGQGELAMTYKGTTFAGSFIDSGSNGIYFTDSSIPLCTNKISTFYCPGSTVSEGPLSIEGTNGVMVSNLSFNVGDTQSMLTTSPTDTFDVLPQLAGALPKGNESSFDYGLAFFYGKRVAIAMEGAATTVGTGPYIAF